MTRAALEASDYRLIEVLQQLRQEAGWTIAEEAEALGLPLETLRGVLFGKNKAGPWVLGVVFDFARRAQAEMGDETPPVVQDVRLAAVELLQCFKQDLKDELWRRVRRGFGSREDLLGFLRVDAQEWDRFAAGEDPSPTLLRTIASAYIGEAQQVEPQDSSDAAWCRQLAELAMRLLELG